MRDKSTAKKQLTVSAFKPGSISKTPNLKPLTKSLFNEAVSCRKSSAQKKSLLKQKA